MGDRVQTDICIAGAGIVGLALALELRSRGLHVTVLEAGTPMRQASTAAAGMLAADDPHNPPELSPLSHLSLSIYPAFLGRIAQLTGIKVPFQTTQTLQAIGIVADARPLRSALSTLLSSSHLSSAGREATLPSKIVLLPEQSIDPRQLASALVAAIRTAGVNLCVGEPVRGTQADLGSVRVSTPTRTLGAGHFIDCTGAWAGDPAYAVVPVKGQILAVSLPKNLPLDFTVRTPDIYIVPRTLGPNAGRAVIGATIEEVGFDTTVHSAQIEELHARATELLPELAPAMVLESWSGLRPATNDRLPMLGPHPAKPLHWIASGHYRNGILLAPATARLMANLILNERTDESASSLLDAFSPSRAGLCNTR